MALRTVSNIGGNWNATTAWVGGVVPLATDTVDFTATSGNLVVNVLTNTLSGIDFTNYLGTITFNNNISVNTSVNLGTGGYTQAGTSGLSINANTTISGTTVWTRGFLIVANAAVTITLSNNLNITDLSLNGNLASLSFILGGNILSISNNISFIGAGAYTLNIPQDLQITNLLIGDGGNRTCTINGLFTLSISGNLTENHGASTVSGTTSIVLNGTGTWNNASTGVIRNNININTTGTITISGNIYYNTGTLTYILGTVITTGSTLNIGASTTLNTNVLSWNNINPAAIITLLSDLYFSGLFENSTATSVTINGFNIYCMSGKLSGVGNGNQFGGNTTFYFKGNSTWSTLFSGFLFDINIIIDCDTLTLPINTNQYATFGAKTLTYLKGNINKNSHLILNNSCTLLNFNKCIIDNIFVGTGAPLITMNEFFSGSPNKTVNLRHSVPSSTYTITFRDGFEKISKFVNISNCTLSKPLQLLVLTNSKRSSTNRGIRYINQSPNGIAKGEPSVNQTTYGAGGLLPDPINL